MARRPSDAAIRGFYGTSDEAAERAFRAVQNFKRMLPGLNSFAQAITRSAVQVQITDGIPRTDGRVIYLRAPITLGDVLTHDRTLCPVRDEQTMLRLCPACARLDEIMSTLFHEIAHITMESFESMRDQDRVSLIERILTEHGDKWRAEAARRGDPDFLKSRYDKLLAKIKDMPDGTNYLQAMRLVSPYLHPIFNALEDARVNRGMYQARNGTRALFQAKAISVFTDGIERPDGTRAEWRDAPANSQMIVGLYAKASGFDYAGWFSPDVEAALNDPDLTRALVAISSARSAASIYRMGFPVLEHLRRLGYCRNENDEKDDTPPPPPPPPAEQPPPPEQDDDEDADAQHDDDESQAGNSPSEDDEDAATSEDGDDDSSDEPTPNDSESDDDSDSDDDNDDESDSDGDDDGEQDAAGDDDSDGGSDADDDSDDESDSDDDDTPTGGASADEQNEQNDDDDDTPAGGAGDDDDDDESADDDDDTPAGGADDDDDDESADDDDDDSDGAGSGDEDEDADDDGDSGDGDDDESDRDDAGLSTEAGDRDGDEDSDDGDDDDGDEQDKGSAEDADEALKQFGGHEIRPQTHSERMDEAEINRAVVQSDNFDAPSRNVYGLNIHTPDKHVIAPNGIDRTKLLGWNPDALDAYCRTDIEAPESLLGRALLKMRVVFADNRQAKTQTGYRSGRVVGRHLPQVKVGNDKVFQRTKQPGKRDYFVVLSLDISGSTGGRLPDTQPDGEYWRRVDLIKAAALAQAELLHRLGVKFAVYAHTALNHEPNNKQTGIRASAGGSETMDVDIFVVKDERDPWDNAARQRLMTLAPAAYNLDGHAMEFLRKRIERSTATDRLIMYYTDGAMPFENYDEELRILQKEIVNCRQRDIKLVGVGVCCDDPVKHGLDTIRIDGLDDLPKLVDELKVRLGA